MTDRDAFLAALRADPADSVRRLVFADWLDIEAGDPAFAAALRWEYAADVVRAWSAGEVHDLRANLVAMHSFGQALTAVSGLMYQFGEAVRRAGSVVGYLAGPLNLKTPRTEMSAANTTKARGIVCECGSARWRLVEVFRNANGTVRRRRACVACGQRITTVERQVRTPAR